MTKELKMGDKLEADLPNPHLFCFAQFHIIGDRDARPAPPRPRGKLLPRAAPAPKIFNSAPPRPAPPRKLPRGKNHGKRSYIIKSFWESKTFDQYF